VQAELRWKILVRGVGEGGASACGFPGLLRVIAQPSRIRRAVDPLPDERIIESQ
jgi:hypothetical protein